MSVRAASLIAAVVALASVPGRAAEFPYDQFKPYELSVLVGELAALEHLPSPPGRHVLWMDRVTKVRVSATFIGAQKPIPKTTADLILKYATAATADGPGYAGLYERAYAFEEGGRRYWFPVQRQVADYLEKDVKPGQRIVLYALVVGGEGEPNRLIEPLLLIQEFDADAAVTS